MNNLSHLLRGVRNNNPANLRRSSAQWKGLSYSFPSDGHCLSRVFISGESYDIPFDNSFCQFSFVEYGVRALIITLRTYMVKYHLYSVEKIVNRFAPAGDGDNKPLQYTAFVTRHIDELTYLGFNYRDTLPIVWSDVRHSESFSYDVLFALCSSICLIESQYHLSKDVFNKALSLL